ncbi:MAG: aspartate/glutamate racemase family protein [Thermoplasmatota archaeon]
MNILYLMPGRVDSDEMERREEIANKLVSEGTTVTVDEVKEGPLSIEYAPEEYMAIPHVLKKLYKIQDEYDAAIIGCFGDPGLRPARELIDIPVIGPAEATMHLALMVGENFSIITILDSVIYATRAQLRELGLESHCTSIRTLGIPVLELGEDEEKTLNAIEELAEDIYNKEKASTILLGCMSEAFLLADEKVKSKIPIINPAKAAFRMAELFVKMNLKHSPISYPKPDMDKLKKADLL